MPTVNMLEAQSTLSHLVEAVESGNESEIIRARNGRPATGTPAKLKLLLDTHLAL